VEKWSQLKKISRVVEGVETGQITKISAKIKEFSSEMEVRVQNTAILLTRATKTLTNYMTDYANANGDTSYSESNSVLQSMAEDLLKIPLANNTAIKPEPFQRCPYIDGKIIIFL
jgi:hypothetical protein